MLHLRERPEMDSMFREKLGLKEPRGMSELITRLQLYINYEKKLMVDESVEG
jgi:hypothetical protein